MLFIAEIGLNHNGNFGLVHELVRQAVNSNADIAKFQLGWRSGKGELNEISSDTLGMIVKIGDHYGIEIMFSIFSEEAYAIAKNFNFQRYKIASRTVKDNPNLVKKILDEGKETYISLGFWDSDDVPFKDWENARYLWCKSVYPTPPWEMIDLPKDFSNAPYVGYSDHTVGLEVALLAIARGAKVIEKHFTLDKSDTTVRDHALSASPDDFALLVEIGRRMEKNILIGV
jgi:N,N'-diacetyllegionaminate synthase